MSARDHFVYRMFDKDGALLYIGCTMRLRDRWGTHNAERPHMTRRAVRFKVQGPYTYEVARQVEREALRTENPEFGWTPAKRREQTLRQRWIKARRQELTGEGMEFVEAALQASREADECWPDPVAHEWGERRLRVVS